MLHRNGIFVLAIVLLLGLLSLQSLYAQESNDDQIWYEIDADNQVNLNLYFFWSITCPHCREAHPYVDALASELPWLRLYNLELTEHPENAQGYVEMASSLGKEAMYVPAFFFCSTMETGYDHADTTGQALKDALIACHADIQQEVDLAVAESVSAGETAATPPTSEDDDGDVAPAALVPSLVEPDTAVSAATLAIPFVGSIDTQSLSLPAITFVIAGLDAFNPCAFFVLMFLLSLMVHAQDRRRMFLIGGVFVLFSGLIYFVFMAAWLNVFLWIGELQVITLVAGLIAIIIALINIKDFFWYKQGVSLSIPESAKPGLYQRTRNLVRAGSLPAMLLSTAVLAVAANSYELLCTAGFPMVYARILTMHELPSNLYYLYLAAYNVIYVIPLLVIVVIFSVRFGSRKLSESEGRVLKLVSGMLMLLLGIVLVVAPALLNQVTTAIMLLVAALAISAVIIFIDRRRHVQSDASFSDGMKPH